MKLVNNVVNRIHPPPQLPVSPRQQCWTCSGRSHTNTNTQYITLQYITIQYITWLHAWDALMNEYST